MSILEVIFLVYLLAITAPDCYSYIRLLLWNSSPFSGQNVTSLIPQTLFLHGSSYLNEFMALGTAAVLLLTLKPKCK